MLRNAVAAARASGARLVLPGNVYNFGPDAGLLLDEAAPQRPATRKGAIRVEMEAMLHDAAGDGVRSLILRAGDFLGAGAPSSWFGNAMVKPGRPVAALTYPGAPGIGHAWPICPISARRWRASRRSRLSSAIARPSTSPGISSPATRSPRRCAGSPATAPCRSAAFPGSRSSLPRPSAASCAS